jgi:hypothetical protein
LDRPGPSRRGICLIRVSEATKASYLRASFLMSFLFLLSFFKSSALMASTPPCLARSISCWSPRMQMLMFGRGTVGSLTVPEKRLSRWGS